MKDSKELIKDYKNLKEAKKKLNEMRELIYNLISYNRLIVDKIYDEIEEIERSLIYIEIDIEEETKNKKIEIKNLNDMIKYNII